MWPWSVCASVHAHTAWHLQEMAKNESRLQRLSMEETYSVGECSTGGAPSRGLHQSRGGSPRSDFSWRNCQARYVPPAGEDKPIVSV